jgi:acetyl-CoA decarbonylase/synthase complex subunit gamma
MAMTGMQIYKILPRTNCKDCGFPTCMAFAMQVAAKQKAMTDCPHLSEDALASASEASAPPMRLVKIGAGEREFQIGQETVMHRHEEKFHRPTGIAVRVPASLSDDEAGALSADVAGKSFVRVGMRLGPKLMAVEVDGVDDPAARVKAVHDKGCLATIILGKDAGKVEAAVAAIAAEKPLVAGADASNLDAFVKLAAANKVPLGITAGSLEELADLTTKAKEGGCEDLVLHLDGSDWRKAVTDLTRSRRAALKHKFRALGYPVMVEVNAPGGMAEPMLASIYTAKYAGIVVVNGAEPWQMLPVLTTAQDIYTDPQVPNTVETKLYEIGSPTQDSPVMFTTNFALSYFSVAGEVERSKVPAYICVVDTEGLGVLNSWAGDQISADKVVKTIKEQGVADKVKHRKLIIPGLLPMFRAEIEDISEWEEVMIGPESAKEIPAYLAANWK